MPNFNKIALMFLDGPMVQVSGEQPALYHVQFINNDSGICIYETDIRTGSWCQANFRYFVNWHVIVQENGIPVLDYKLDLKEKNVFILLNSTSLGDTISWIPYVEEFRIKHQCQVTVATHWNRILAPNYPDLKFIEPGTEDPLQYWCAYRIGCYDNDYNKNKNNWRLIPLQQVAADFLGLEHKESKPKIYAPAKPRPFQERYVAISEFSTLQGKLWNHQGGWQKLVNYLNEAEYKVVSISKENTKLSNVVKRNNLPIEDTINYLQHCDFYIGVSSGLAWTAWALGVPHVMISGITDPFFEMKDGIRIINKDVCHGCFNDQHSQQFDRNNWMWCPRNKNFECTTKITTESVIEAIQPLIKNKPKNEPVIHVQNRIAEDRIVFLLPHCSTGGMPQYVLQCVRELKESGTDSEVIEYTCIAENYNIQRKKIKELVPFHTLTGDKPRALMDLVSRINPKIVHLQEAPELWAYDSSSSEAFNLLYNQNRTYRIIETSHCSILPKKEHLPDGYAFVSGYHPSKLLLDKPHEVVEYNACIVRPRNPAVLEFGLDPLKKHILNVGLFTRGKNQGEALEIARKLPQYEFHFVGNTADNFMDYWGPILKNRPSNSVIWGEREDVEWFYRSMDALLFTSINELNPLVPKEAIAHNMHVFMRNLPTYCGMYNGHPLVTFIDNDLDRTCEKIDKFLFPMAGGLRALYRRI